MNRFEQIKLDLTPARVLLELHKHIRSGAVDLPRSQAMRLKLLGLALRQRTPGYYMIRVRVPGGRLDTRQLCALAHVAQRFGRGQADLTARGQLQLRWIRLHDVPAIFERLQAVGLLALQTLMDSVRSLRTCPLADLSLRELFSIRPVIEQLERATVGQADFANLPHKLNIAVTACTDACCDARTQDLALVPAWGQGDNGRPRAGFNVLVGGKISGNDFHAAQPLDVFVSPDRGAEVLLHLMRLYRDHGSRRTRTRSRLAYLLQKRGVAWLRDQLQRRWDGPLAPAGREACDERARTCPTLGTIPQKQPGRTAVGLAVPVGRVRSEELLDLAQLAERYGDGQVRLTAQQNVMLVNVDETRLDALLAEPLLRRWPTDPHPLVQGTMSCTGSAYCDLAIIETKNHAVALAAELARRVPEAQRLSIHWSGCNAGCGRHLVADIGLLGRKTVSDGQVVEAADVYIGGSAGSNPSPAFKLLEAVPCHRLADVLEPLVRFGVFDKFRRTAASRHLWQTTPLMKSC